MGRCPDCQAWNSLVAETMIAPAKGSNSRAVTSGIEPTPITRVAEDGLPRIDLPFREVNRVLGGGLTRGSVALLAGDPGIGKSTLLLQIMGTLANVKGKPLLYISGEESARQIKLRAERLGVAHDRLFVLPETNLVDILAHLEKSPFELVVVDSVQTVYWPDLPSVPGSISQVREVADRLIRLAKQKDITVFLVGHVNKEGGIAGPMALEHLVDTVLFFEGERGQPYRILRAMKNRFGPTDEVGVFDMTNEGLREVANPSELFLKHRPKNTPGTAVFPVMEGTRPLLVEVQGLATHTSYGVPLRNAVGFDKNRLTMLLAVLEKRAGLRMETQDVYVNVVGGIRLVEPAADLAVVAAVVSSFLGKIFPTDAVVFGEVGLAGEIRVASRGDARLKEASKLGFAQALVPPGTSDPQKSIRCQTIDSIDTLVDFLR